MAKRIYDVAKLAGVSTATVSAVVNGQDVVEAKTKRRVLAAIKKLNYQPNLYASNLARGRTRLLGLIVSDIANPFFAEIAQVVQREALARGYQVFLAATEFSQQRLLSSIQQMIGLRVGGLAIMTSEMEPHVLEVLRSHNIPAIFEDVGTVSDTISNIRIDYEGGIFKAVKYLVDLGHKRILFVRTYPGEGRDANEFLSLRLRARAFHNAVRQFRDSGVSAEVVVCPGPGPQAGLCAIRQALEGTFRFTAAVAVADPVALGVLRGLREAGMSVPRDVSLIGFDNSYLCDFTDPPLSSVDVPRETLGRLVVDSLIRNVEHAERGRELPLPTELVIRESTTRRAAARGRAKA